MKKILFTCLFALLAIGVQAQKGKDTHLQDSIYQVAEVMPEHPGGLVACMKWFAEQLPSPPMQSVEEPVVVAQFIVEKDGSITSPEITRGISRSFDRKVLRLVKKMPPWKPALREGNPVRFRYTLYLRFHRNEETTVKKVFIIEGSLENIEDGIAIQLFRLDGQAGVVMDVDTLENGKFHFRQEANDNVEQLSLAVQSPKFPYMPRKIFVAPGCYVKIYADNHYIYTWAVESHVKEQQEYDRYLMTARKEFDEMQKLEIERLAFVEAVRTDKKMTEAEKEKANKRVKELRGLIAEWGRKAEGKQIALLKKTPVTPIWLDVFAGFCMMTKYYSDYPHREEVFSLYNRLTEEQKNTERGKEITAYLFPSDEDKQSIKPL